LAIGVDVVDEAAGAAHVRIAQKILGAVDRREADVQGVELLRELRHVPALDLVRDPRNDPCSRQNPVGSGEQARVLGKFRQADFPAKASPIASADSAAYKD